MHSRTQEKKIVGLERGPLCLVSTTEKLPGRNSSDSGLEIREYGRRDLSRWPRGILYPQKLSLASLTSGGRSVGIVRLRTEAMEVFLKILRSVQWGGKEAEKWLRHVFVWTTARYISSRNSSWRRSRHLCFLSLSLLQYYSNLKMEAICPVKSWLLSTNYMGSYPRWQNSS
jgi:hypothetical protein